MTVQSLVRALGTPVLDASEETFELFAQDLPSQNLGFIDPRAPTLDLTIAGRDLTIHQSPGILSSNRAGGTTGAVVWKIAPLFAAWLASTNTTTTTTSPKRATTTTTTTSHTKHNTKTTKPNNVNNNEYTSPVPNPLFTHSVLSPASHVLELGAGISALPALLLAPHVARYVLTDQPYVARLVEQNLAENLSSATTSGGGKHAAAAAAAQGKGKGKGKKTPPKPKGGSAGVTGAGPGKAVFAPLDWETDAVAPSLTHTPGVASFDAVVACDCVYNEALIQPFVETCAAACRLRSVDNSTTNNTTTTTTNTADDDDGGGEEGKARGGKKKKEPCVCVVAQQLRDPDVFERWLEGFGKVFDVWRVPEAMVGRELGGGAGFVVHVGVLKGEVGVEGLLEGGEGV